MEVIYSRTIEKASAVGWTDHTVAILSHHNSRILLHFENLKDSSEVGSVFSLLIESEDDIRDYLEAMEIHEDFESDMASMNVYASGY